MNLHGTDSRDYWQRINAAVIRHEPAERRLLLALAMTPEARQRYVYRVRAKHGHDAAVQLVEAIRGRGR